MKNKLKQLIPNKIKNFILSMFNGNYHFLFWFLPLSKDKIVICNYYGKGYGDNGKYISEEIIKQGHTHDIVWLLDKELINKTQFPPRIRVAKYGSFRGLYELATAKVWIDNCRKFFYPPKRNNQYYIQTWHGGIALKQVERDVVSKLDSYYINYAKRDSKMADIFISNSTFCSDMYKSAFWYEKKILECGTPRCDNLVNESNKVKIKVRSYFNIDNDVQLLIYAPTFRADLNTKAYDIDFVRLIEVLEERFGGEWNILVRLHPNVSFKHNFMEYSSKIINATNYDDMYELLAVCNILITDYSSTMFEFSFSYKPVLLYANDIDEYVKDRDFYFDIHSLPYPLATNNEQLFDLIVKLDNSVYLNNLKEFLAGLEVFEEGNATAKVVELIEILKNK
ncbi:CDP-glycerol glycerophosphotransferase family protein [Cytobacillus horneckiae]|uniref:CDP-glycerol glycerophosphotransferase family protein n=1 Tax=Cytobacillus horneckiae TaxID=549687 RepID=UPI003D9A6CF2